MLHYFSSSLPTGSGFLFLMIKRAHELPYRFLEFSCSCRLSWTRSLKTSSFFCKTDLCSTRVLRCFSSMAICSPGVIWRNSLMDCSFCLSDLSCAPVRVPTMMMAAKATAQTPPLNFCCLVRVVDEAILGLVYPSFVLLSMFPCFRATWKKNVVPCVAQDATMSPAASPDLVGLVLALNWGHAPLRRISSRGCRKLQASRAAAAHKLNKILARRSRCRFSLRQGGRRRHGGQRQGRPLVLDDTRSRSGRGTVPGMEGHQLNVLASAPAGRVGRRCGSNA